MVGLPLPTAALLLGTSLIRAATRHHRLARLCVLIVRLRLTSVHHGECEDKEFAPTKEPTTTISTEVQVDLAMHTKR